MCRIVAQHGRALPPARVFLAGTMRNLTMSLFSRRTPQSDVSDIKHYRTEDGYSYFTFRFVPNGGHFDIYCLRHPPLNGQDDSVHKTHLYSNSKICFVAGREPHNQRRAKELAKQWAEYFSEYTRTG